MTMEAFAMNRVLFPNPFESLHHSILANNAEHVVQRISGGVNVDQPLVASRISNKLIAELRRFHPETPLVPVNLALFNVNREFSETKGSPQGTSLQILSALLNAGAAVEVFCPTHHHDDGKNIRGEAAVKKEHSTMELALWYLGQENAYSLPDKVRRQRTNAMIKVISMLSNAAKKQRTMSPAGVLETMLPDEDSSDDDACLADITFVCPDGKKVLAHKNILAASVPYFKKAFSMNWKENTTQEWKTDKSAHVTRTILKFIYTGKLEFVPDPNIMMMMQTKHGIILNVYRAAHEFQIGAILKECETELSNLVDILNLRDLLETVLLYNASSLKSSCFQFMKTNAVSVLSDHNIIQFGAQNKELWNEFQQSLYQY